jgi:hypothetical protein
MRDPAIVLSKWPALVEGMAPTAELLSDWVERQPTLRNLAKCMGPEPDQRPPDEGVLQEVRDSIEVLWGLGVGESTRHHEASPWRYALVQKAGEMTEDPDVHLGRWLRDGAPMGIQEEI